MPTAVARPWPSGPVVVSTPGVWPYSGWPGVAEPLLVARGIAVYPEVAQRKVSLRVPDELAAKLKGPVRIRYSEDREIGGGTIDEAERVVK